jgi:glutaredoxin
MVSEKYRTLKAKLQAFESWPHRYTFKFIVPGERRAELDGITSTMKMYQFKQCPFCVKTRRNIRRLGLNIELRDARNDPKWNNELITQGGKYQVPCLRLQNEDGSSEWMYGSDDIIRYLDQRFG